MLSWWPLPVFVVGITFFIPLWSIISPNCSFHRAHFSLLSMNNHSLLWDQLFFIILVIAIHALLSFIPGDPCVFLISRNWGVGWLFWVDGMDFIYCKFVGMSGGESRCLCTWVGFFSSSFTAGYGEWERESQFPTDHELRRCQCKNTLGHNSQPRRLGCPRKFSLREEHLDISLESNASMPATLWTGKERGGWMHLAQLSTDTSWMDLPVCNYSAPFYPPYLQIAGCECAQVLIGKPVSPALQPNLAND